MSTPRIQPLLVVGFVLLVTPLHAQDVIDTYSATFNHDLNQLIEETMGEWDVPGLAVGVVKDDEVVFLKGFGYADIETQRPVDPQSSFRIASVTKSFTALLIGTLVDEGLLDLDVPIREYWSGFQMQEPYVSTVVTMRDLLSHQTGVPRHDILWFFPKVGMSREAFYSNVRYLDTNLSFRQAHQYNNIMFSLSTYIAEQVSGTAWTEQLQTQVLDKLGMDETSLDAPDPAVLAAPYVKQDGAVTFVQNPIATADYIASAGALFSSANDMTKYLRFLINAAHDPQNPVVTKRYFSQMIASQVSQRGPTFGGYGLGLRVVDYNGHKVVWHFGATTGYSSLLSFVPEERIGIIVLTNAGFRNPTNLIIRNIVFDKMLGESGQDWVSVYRERFRTILAEQEEEAFESQPPIRVWEAYAGTYEHPAYGIVEIASLETGLTFILNGHDDFDVQYRQYDAFRIQNRVREDIAYTLTFSTDGEGAINRLEIPFEERVAPIVFVKR